MDIQKSENLQRHAQECKWYALCPMKRFYESGRLESKWIESYCMNGGLNCLRFSLEEQGRFHPDWMLPDGTLDIRLKDMQP